MRKQCAAILVLHESVFGFTFRYLSKFSKLGNDEIVDGNAWWNFCYYFFMSSISFFFFWYWYMADILYCLFATMFVIFLTNWTEIRECRKRKIDLYEITGQELEKNRKGKYSNVAAWHKELGEMAFSRCVTSHQVAPPSKDSLVAFVRYHRDITE